MNPLKFMTSDGWHNPIRCAPLGHSSPGAWRSAGIDSTAQASYGRKRLSLTEDVDKLVAVAGFGSDQAVARARLGSLPTAWPEWWTRKNFCRFQTTVGNGQRYGPSRRLIEPKPIRLCHRPPFQPGALLQASERCAVGRRAGCLREARHLVVLGAVIPPLPNV